MWDLLQKCEKMGRGTKNGGGTKKTLFLDTIKVFLV